MQSSDHPPRRTDGDGLQDTIDAPGGGQAVRASRDRALRDASSDDYTELRSVDPAHYVLGAEVAAGGMGRVVRARDRRLGREVAIKELLPDRKDAAIRFETEARITARLQHPAIVNIYEAGVWPNGDPFYAMTMVAGRSLEDVVAERTSLAQRLGLLPNVTAVVDALAYAHSQRVIHRDLKPQNVLIGEFGETIVIDWGLAKDLSGDAAPDQSLPRISATRSIVTGAGGVVGTPAYMAPEQARGEPVDERADVYALGALIRYIVTGAAPVAHDSAKQVLDRVLAGDLAPMTTRRAPADLLAIIQKAMAFDPADRYPTASELAADLKRFQTGQLVAAYEYSRRERVARWMRRNRAVLAVGVVALGVVATLGGLGLQRILDERAAAERGRASLLQLQGRQELLAGRPGAALAYLSAVYDEGFDSPPLRLLIAEAVRPYETPFVTLSGHSSSVIATQFTPDGARVLTAGRDGVVMLWNAATGARLQKVDHGAMIAYAELDPTGTRFVTAGADGAARVWSAADGGELHSLDDCDEPLYKARFSPDGALVATGCADGTARVWRPQSDEVATLRGHEGAVTDVAFAPESQWVATSSADGTARVWTTAGELVATMRGHSQAVNSVQFSESGEEIATASRDASGRVWNAQSGDLVATLRGHKDEVISAVFSRGGWHVVTASADGTAIVWDTKSGRLLAILRGHRDAVSSAKFSPSGRYVLTAGFDRAVRMWDWEGEKSIVLLEGHAGVVSDASFDATGTRIASTSGDRTARVWSATEQTVRLSFKAHRRGVMTAQTDSGGTRIVTAGSDPTARVWNAATGDKIREIEEERGIVFTASFSPDGERVVTGTDRGGVAVWDASSGSLIVRPAGHDAIVLSTSWSPDGTRIVTTGDDQVARVWDASTGELALTLEGHEDSVYAAAFGPDAKRIATSGADGRAMVWNAATGQRIAEIPHVGVVLSVAFSDDGTRLATAGGSGARVWRFDGAAPSLVCALERPGLVYSARFSPDGAFLATAGGDATARVWDAETGELLAVREGHVDRVMSARFGPDARTLVTASEDGTVRVWDFALEQRPPSELAQFVNDRVPWALESGTLITRSGQGGSLDSH